MKFGLRNIKTLLKSVGNPERQFCSIHIAGTNGKGSTASFLASIFMEAGYKTALYTSPHLIRFTERIRINGKEISEKELVEYAEPLIPTIEKTNATFFEATTCIAFQYFADQKVDIAVVEAGLGGRLDSTNVLLPMVSVITNVSFDHTEYLGTTLKKIAWEKGGIIKKNIPCVTSSRDKTVVATLRGIAKRRSSRLIEVRKQVATTASKLHANPVCMNFLSQHVDVRDVKLGLTGNHQIANAASAVATIDTLLSKRNNVKTFPRLNRKSVKNGLIRVRKNTGLHGRLETSGMKKRYILDVAHNTAGLEALVAALPARFRNNLVVVFGVMKDKDYPAMCKIVAQTAAHVIAVQSKTQRALPSAEITDRMNLAGTPAINGGSVVDGMLIADSLAGESGKILITGSHYVVGEALEILQSEANSAR